ncbi:15303_t:CDS:2 [Gigaspora margarita]|uniref:15303_t:CDS:1 n=1 Tax=Gigaspora margarita TaxID=4874 RepID=A0ABM8W127_GIGMA|nr:15303_t:CDS:2 [Gigaspora margarita]
MYKKPRIAIRVINLTNKLTKLHSVNINEIFGNSAYELDEYVLSDLGSESTNLTAA